MIPREDKCRQVKEPRRGKEGMSWVTKIRQKWKWQKKAGSQRGDEEGVGSTCIEKERSKQESLVPKGLY